MIYPRVPVVAGDRDGDGDETEAATPEITPELISQLDSETALLRGNIDELLAELDRRRHRATDLAHQVELHPLISSAAGLGAALLLGGTGLLALVRYRRRRRPFWKLKQLGAALRRVYEHPEQVARPKPDPLRKLLLAATSAVVARAAQQLFDRGRHVIDEGT